LRPPHFLCVFLCVMTTSVPLDVGKYALLGVGSSAYSTQIGEVVIVIEHKVNAGSSTLNMTTVAVVKDMITANVIAAEAYVSGDATVAPALLRATEAVKFTDLTNRALGALMGAGLWKNLFDASTPVLKPAALAPAGTARPDPAAGLFGMTFSASLPVIENNAIVMIEGTWKVENRVSAGKLTLTSTVGGTAYSTELADAEVSKFTTRRAVTDCAFDVSAYANVRKSLECLLAGDELQARVIFKLSQDLGVPVHAEALKDDATDSVLRRHSASLVNAWDSWFDFLLASGRVSVIIRCPDRSQVLVQLRAAKAAFESATPPPPLAGQLGGGLGLPFPAAAGATASGALPASGIVISTTSTPRLEALLSLAVDQMTQDTFCNDVMVMVEPDVAVRTMVCAHPDAMQAQIERWLRPFGAATDPILVRGKTGSQSAGELLTFCLGLRASASPNPASSSGLGAGVALQRVRVNVRSSTDSEQSTLSEADRRDRTQLQSDIQALENDATALKRLAEMKAIADVGGKVSIEKVQSLVDGESDGALRRLVYSAPDPGSVTVDAEPDTVHALVSIRGLLDSRLERSVCGAKTSISSDQVVRQLRWIRLRRIGRVRLPELMDVSDSGTEASPLAQFAKMERGAAVSLFTMALSRLQNAWVFSSPAHGGQAMMFISALQSKCIEALSDGVSWADVGIFYRAVIRRVDRGSNGFAGNVSVVEAPDPSWATDHTLEWVSDLRQKVGEAKSDAKHQSRIDSLISQGAAAAKGSDAKAKAKETAATQQPMTPEEKAAAAEKKRKADSNRDKKKAKQAKKAAAPVGGGAPPAAAAQGGAAANASLGLDFDLTAETAKLEATMGKDAAGKSPCYFHHTAGKKCRYEADQCKRYH
jgi:hypothetical protein